MIQPQIASGAGENGWNSSCLSGDKTDTLSVDQQIAYGTDHVDPFSAIRGMDFGRSWKTPVRSEEKQQHGEGKSICPALASDEGVILWRKRPCVDRIFGTVSLLSHGPLIEGSPLIAR